MPKQNNASENEGIRWGRDTPKIIQILVLDIGKEESAKLCRRYGINDKTLKNWKKQFCPRGFPKHYSDVSLLNGGNGHLCGQDVVMQWVYWVLRRRLYLGRQIDIENWVDHEALEALDVLGDYFCRDEEIAAVWTRRFADGSLTLPAVLKALTEARDQAKKGARHLLDAAITATTLAITDASG